MVSLRLQRPAWPVRFLLVESDKFSGFSVFSRKEFHGQAAGVSGMWNCSRANGLTSFHFRARSIFCVPIGINGATIWIKA